MDPFANHLYVFFNRKGDNAKILAGQTMAGGFTIVSSAGVHLHQSEVDLIVNYVYNEYNKNDYNYLTKTDSEYSIFVKRKNIVMKRC